ncbi:hypothetical protein JCM10213v2_000504 [Rhodosporidiobolus nylandii]
MATPPSATPAASALAPHLSPSLHCFTDPSLEPILERNHIPSLAALLQPFTTSVTRVTVRTHNYEHIQLPAFPFHLVHRQLPPGFGQNAKDGAPTGRARSGSVLSPPAGAPGTPSTPTAAQVPSQAERDELFLDSLGASLASQLPSLLATAPEEVNVRPVSLRPRLPEQGDVPEKVQEDVEGWEGRTAEELSPWFDEMQRQVLGRRDMVEWETFAWPVGCLLALSTSSPDPLNALSALWELTSPASLFSPASYPPKSGAEEDGRHEWANGTDVLRFVVLVHDWGAGGGPSGWKDALDLHETIRKTYGLHTALLPIFSASPNAAHPQPPSPSAQALWSFLAPPSPSLPLPHAVEPVVGLGYEGYDVDAPDPASGSAPPPPPAGNDDAQPAKEVSDADVTALQKFVREMVVQSVIPFMERQVVVGNEAFTASRRSLGGRLFSAGRKYFGGGRDSSLTASGSGALSRSGSLGSGGASGQGWNAAKGYPSTAPESATRRLADLAFMLGDFKLAQQVYDQASKDFKADKAWRYYAAACPSSPQSPDAYLLLASLTPTSSASSSFDALRATLLYYLAYRSLPPSARGWDAAPVALLRAAEGLGEEVAAAVLLEQAALADLRAEGRWEGAKKGRRRRFALHMAMAAARYEKCGVKPLSLRCLSQASSLYSLPPSPSSSSSDEPPSPASTSLSDPRLPPPSVTLSSFLAIRQHLHHSLARQSYTAGSSLAACRAFLELLAGSPPGGDASEAAEWLDDFALAWAHLAASSSSAAPSTPEQAAEAGLTLPVRLVDAQQASVKVGSVGVAGGTGGQLAGGGWEVLERGMLEGWQGQGKRPGRVQWRGGEREEAVLGELFHLALPVHNPLEAFLALGKVRVEMDAEEGALDIEELKEVELAPGERSVVFVPIRAHRLGTYTILSVSYLFASLLPVREPLSSPSARYSRPTLPAPGKPSTRAPNPLQIKVVPAVPVLSVEIAGEEGLPERLVEGEMRRVTVKVENAGGVPIQELHALVSHPSFAFISPAPAAANPSAPRTSVPVANHLRANKSVALLEEGRVVQPGEELEVEVLCRGSEVGEVELQWLFAFKAAEDDSSECFSTRAVHPLEVLPSLDLRCSARPNARAGSPFILSVEAYNIGIPASEVHITSISLISPRWAMSLAPGASFADDVSPPLGWQQGTRFFLALDAAAESPVGSRDDPADFTVRKLDALLSGKEVGKDLPGEVELRASSVSSDSAAPDTLSSALLPAILASHNARCLSSLSTSYPTLPAALHAQIFPLLPSLSSALVVVSYSSPSLSTFGHLLLPLSLPLPSLDAPLRGVLDAAERTVGGGLYEESQRERTALLAALRKSELGGGEEGAAVPTASVGVEVEEPMQHDFAAGPCVIPIRFHLRNLSPSTTLSYILTLGANDSPRGAMLAGALTHIGALPPLSLSTVPSQLWVPRPGVFRAGNWRLVVQQAGEAGGTRYVQEGGGREIRVRDLAASRPLQTVTPAPSVVVEVRA